MFVSSDKDEASFNEYYGEMSFFAVPYAARDVKENLSSKYGVSGIPTLVLLDGNGELLQNDICGQHTQYLKSSISPAELGGGGPPIQVWSRHVDLSNFRNIVI